MPIPRQGWAEDAKRIASADDDQLVWPEFANEDDTALDW
jgi:antitoxin MazE